MAKRTNRMAWGAAVALAAVIVGGGALSIRRGAAWILRRWEAGMPMTGVDLQGAVLTGGNLVQINLTGADLQGADLSGAHLEGATLRRADLREADLTGATLVSRGAGRADLTGADLRG